MDYIQLFDHFKEQSISGRYITNKHIEPILENLKTNFEVSVIGKSVKNKPIYSVKIGDGKTKVFMWSQMHGNESTTTKALFDLFNFLQSDTNEAKEFKKNFTLLCIPIANPDGAEAYTRVNSNNIDLNRDSVDLSQPESKLLRRIFDNFKPDFCFNLHDQRTIFAAGNTQNPATVSFLAPSYNEATEYNVTRLKAVRVIVAMNSVLQNYIPNQIGRFDDEFNENCIGDSFQKLGVPTILFEAGHFPNDYLREETRKYIFISYLSSLKHISENVIVGEILGDYLDIPQNKSIFYDFVYRNFKFNENSSKIITNFAAHYKEILVDETIVFEACIVEVGNSLTNYGHFEYDGDSGEYSDDETNFPEIGKKANFRLNNTISFVNGSLVNK
jgi:Zinc carboxypeptidase